MPSKMPGRPWQEISGDFFGPMRDGIYYFVNHDDYSRWPALDQTRSTSFKATKPILDFENLKKLHEFARANDEKAKAKMKAEFDARMKAREPQIKVGGRVLVKLEQKSKPDPFWDPDSYVVVNIKGSLVTAKEALKR